MKKSVVLLLTLLVIFSFFGSAEAGPEEVSIVPVSKWNYKDVDGWGFYAKNGEYSWFAFILRNPSSREYTVTLPAEVDVAHNTRHKIVNTAYKAMYNGSVDFFYEGYHKEYFSESFTLPKDSTYAVFFDVTNMQPYSMQWDTDVFFSIRISDQQTSRVLPITGVLAYDAKNTTPEKITIVTQGPSQNITVDPNANSGTTAEPAANPLTSLRFCREYSSSDKKVRFSYTLKNNTSVTIPLELATSIAAEGQKDIAMIRYTGCESGGSSCASRISNGIFDLNAGETAKFSGEATLPAKPAKANFYIRTSLRFDYNGRKLIPFLIGYASDACLANPSMTDPTVIPVTPASGNNGGLVNAGFCRNYDAGSRKVSFSYALRNTSKVTIPVELATSLAIEGLRTTVPLRYTGCVSGGSSCANRISGGIFKLNAGETAEFRGEASLPSNPSNPYFYIKTSLRYDFNGRTLIPFLVGYTTNTCTAPHALSADETRPNSTDGSELAFRIINDNDTEMTIVPGPISRGNTLSGSYEGIAAISAIDAEIIGSSNFAFKGNEEFILPPYSTASITFSLPEGFSAADEGLIWNYSVDGTGYTFTLNETQPKAITEPEKKTTEDKDELHFYRIGDSATPGGWSF